MADITTIRVSIEVHRRLQAFGKMGETFDELLKRLLDRLEKDGE